MSLVVSQSRSGGGAGAGVFTVGPADNIFGDTGETGSFTDPGLSIAAAADRTTAEATRDTYFAANPSNLASYDGNPSLGIYLFYFEGVDTVLLGQTRSQSAWVDSASTVALRGETGPAGATGNSYFFKSVDARDDFFEDDPNYQLLETNLPISVNIDETLTSYFWSGEDQNGGVPYDRNTDADLWIPVIGS